MTPLSCLAVMLGGAIGSLARYAVGVWAAPISQQMPWATIIINVAGSFVIAFFATLTLAHGRFPASDNARLFVMVGFCGGFTTFSSFSLQTLDLLRGGAPGRAAVNIVGSVVLCVLAAWIGFALASNLNGGARQTAQSIVEEDAS